MKKVTLLISLIVMGFSAICQEAADASGVTWGMVETAVKKSDASLDDVSKNIKSAYWKNKKHYYFRYYEYDLKGLYFGISQENITLAKSVVPKNQKQEGAVTIQSFDRLDIHIKDGKLIKYVRTENYNKENVLSTAVEAYKKAVELDVKGKLKNEVGPILKSIADYLQTDALIAYYSEDYINSLKAFDQIISIYEIDYVKVPDTIVNAFYTDCGTVARTAKNYEKAIEFYQKAANKGVGGAALYGEMYVCYNMLGDSLKAAEILKTGIANNPDDKQVVELTNELINYYLRNGKDIEAREYLEKAMAQKPDLAVYPFSLGYLYAKAFNIEKATEFYEKALLINGNYADAYLNYGVMYVEYGNKIIADASNIKDMKLYDAERVKALAQFKIAIPKIEKYIELTDDIASKINALTDLEKLYYKIEDYTKSKEIKLQREALLKK
ncbi:MAG: hypothetical protein IPO21_05995 [Bacteroidales bacterium]|nr:hypothetical protein [Bacteroidales bacterium]